MKLLHHTKWYLPAHLTCVLFSGDLGKEAGNAVPQCPAWGTGDGREGEGKLRQQSIDKQEVEFIAHNRGIVLVN